MIRKLIILAFFFLCGACHSPLYYSHTQEIKLTIPENSQAEYEGNLIKKKNKFNEIQFEINRSWFDKEIIIKKEGFEDYHLKLDSVWTDEKWAKTATFFGEKETSALDLLFPKNTIAAICMLPVVVASPFIALFENDITPFQETLQKEGRLLSGAVYNLISIPGLPLINPWTKYEYGSHPILIPTPKFEEECHNKKDTFIGNSACLSCGIKQDVISSKEECERCSNRVYRYKYCRLKIK